MEKLAQSQYVLQGTDIANTKFRYSKKFEHISFEILIITYDFFFRDHLYYSFLLSVQDILTLESGHGTDKQQDTGGKENIIN